MTLENKLLLIRLLKSSDVPLIVSAFARSDWTEKSASIFEKYLNEQNQGKRVVWVAYYENQFSGYVTLKWKSQYKSFANNNIPEIMDLNVLPSFRGYGIGAKLLEVSEKEAATKSDIVGIGVGLYGGLDGGYGAAQKLYVKSGYIPDGKGVTYKYKSILPGKKFLLDDDLILWFTKKLRSNS